MFQFVYLVSDDGASVIGHIPAYVSVSIEIQSRYTVPRFKNALFRDPENIPTPLLRSHVTLSTLTCDIMN